MSTNQMSHLNSSANQSPATPSTASDTGATFDLPLTPATPVDKDAEPSSQPQSTKPATTNVSTSSKQESS